MRALCGLALLSLTGCHILFPEDPRVGSEPEAACTARLSSDLRLKFEAYDSAEDSQWVPTYTYDITKLSLDAIQGLTVEGTNQTAGRDLLVNANETATAVAQFKKLPVDESGALFFAEDPALYRVRGEVVAFGDAIATGCARQQENMRLIDVDLAPLPETDPDNTETTPENAQSQNESQ